jgi:hypothetical protein
VLIVAPDGPHGPSRLDSTMEAVPAIKLDPDEVVASQSHLTPIFVSEPAHRHFEPKFFFNQLCTKNLADFAGAGALAEYISGSRIPQFLYVSLDAS